MCGIAGTLDRSGRRDLATVVEAMTSTLRHRGPDDEGVWSDRAAGAALGSRRLAIVDLSENGHQPMESRSGRYLIAFNGEIYNFEDLREELSAHGERFRGHSDTEVFLAVVERWGLEETLRRSNGMFALALWDRERSELHLARDRLGEKPLYYGWMGGAFLFGSEVKALRAHPGFEAEIDRDALAMFLRYKYVPTPRSIYTGVSKLPAGKWLSVRADGSSEGPVAYWSLDEAAERGLADPFAGTADEAVEELGSLLGDAVARRMVADVPVGAFLSGGIDSSTIVALMQEASDRPAKTFTIGLEEAGWNEAADARRVASHLGTDHTELTVTPAEAREVIPRLARVYDEPFGDSSQIPTLLVSELARRDVTVSLSGDGGDEVFGGYNRHVWGAAVARRASAMPRTLRRAASGALTSISPTAWDSMLRPLGALSPGLRHRLAGEKVHKLARALDSEDAPALYRSVISHWSDPASVVLGTAEPEVAAGNGMPMGTTERMMLLDAATYLPDDILTKLDRATMAVSLEGRVPFLDHRVVELAWRLPLRMKVREGQGKWILRRLLDRYVPREMVDRPKMGFGVPLSDWLRGPLRGWAEDLLDPARLRREGYLRPEPILRAWREHLSRRKNRQYELWDVLMFQSWLESAQVQEGVTR